MKPAAFLVFCLMPFAHCLSQSTSVDPLHIRITEVKEIHLEKEGSRTVKLAEDQFKLFVHFVNYAAQDQECTFGPAEFTAEVHYLNGSTRKFFFNKGCLTEDHKYWFMLGEPGFMQAFWK